MTRRSTSLPSHYSSLDLHRSVEFRLEKSVFDQVLHSVAVSHNADAAGLISRDPPVFPELLRVGGPVKMLLGDVSDAIEAVGPTGKTSSDVGQGPEWDHPVASLLR